MNIIAVEFNINNNLNTFPYTFENAHLMFSSILILTTLLAATNVCIAANVTYPVN